MKTFLQRFNKTLPFVKIISQATEWNKWCTFSLTIEKECGISWDSNVMRQHWHNIDWNCFKNVFKKLKKNVHTLTEWQRFYNNFKSLLKIQYFPQMKQNVGRFLRKLRDKYGITYMYDWHYHNVFR